MYDILQVLDNKYIQNLQEKVTDVLTCLQNAKQLATKDHVVYVPPTVSHIIQIAL